MTLCACKVYSQKCNCTCPSIYESKLYTKVCGYQCAMDDYLNDFSSECNLQCPLECESTSYHLSAYKLTSDLIDIQNESFSFNFSNMSEQNRILQESYLENVIKFIFYFDESKYTEISQIAKTSLPDIVSNVGGTLGLFLGLSLLSFIEIFDFIIEAFFVAKAKFKMKISSTQPFN